MVGEKPFWKKKFVFGKLHLKKRKLKGFFYGRVLEFLKIKLEKFWGMVGKKKIKILKLNWGTGGKKIC